MYLARHDWAQDGTAVCSSGGKVVDEAGALLTYVVFSEYFAAAGSLFAAASSRSCGMARYCPAYRPALRRSMKERRGYITRPEEEA